MNELNFQNPEFRRQIKWTNNDLRHGITVRYYVNGKLSPLLYLKPNSSILSVIQTWDLFVPPAYSVKQYVYYNITTFDEIKKIYKNLRL